MKIKIPLNRRLEKHYNVTETILLLYNFCWWFGLIIFLMWPWNLLLIQYFCYFENLPEALYIKHAIMLKYLRQFLDINWVLWKKYPYQRICHFLSWWPTWITLPWSKQGWTLTVSGQSGRRQANCIEVYYCGLNRTLFSSLMSTK